MAKFKNPFKGNLKDISNELYTIDATTGALKKFGKAVKAIKDADAAEALEEAMQDLTELNKYLDELEDTI